MIEWTCKESAEWNVTPGINRRIKDVIGMLATLKERMYSVLCKFVSIDSIKPNNKGLDQSSTRHGM
jgi:hypothetical protein